MHARAEHPSKKKCSLRSMVFAFSCVMALAVALIPPPVVAAQRSEPAAVVKTVNPLSAAARVPGARLVHTATADNITSNWTEIDHPLTNNNPDAILLVTRNLDRGGPWARYNDHAIGVWYRDSRKRWAIFNQDQASMFTNTQFNVMVRTPGADAIVRTATPANGAGYWTDIDHPLSNGNPNALLFVTQNYNPGGGSGVYNDRAIGVWYRSSAEKWAIFNQPITGIPTGASFNVVVIPRYQVHMPMVLRGS